MKSAWRLLARHRDYRLVLISGLVSLTGDWILTIGLTYSVYRLTGSTLASGTMLLAVFLPQVALGSLAGVFVDRWDRRWTMVSADLLMAAGLLPIVLVHGPDQVWIIYLVAFWEGGVEQFFTPAQAATVPRLVDADELTAANGAYGQIQNVARLVGSAVGGVVAACGGLTGVAIADAASFVLSAGLLAQLQVRRECSPLQSRQATGTLPAWREWAAGIHFSWHDPVLRLLAVFMAVSSIGEGIMLTLMAPFVIRVLHGDASSYGAILALQAVGGITGGLLIAAYGARLSTRMLVGIGSVLFGALDLLLFLYPLITPRLWPAGLLIALAGLPGAGIVAGYTTALQVRAGDDHRGRVFGAFASVSAATILLGIVGGGALGGVLGIIPVIAAQGGGYCLVGLYLTAALRSRGGSTALSAGPASLSRQSREQTNREDKWPTSSCSTTHKA